MTELIYYIQRDGLIKIGWTKRLASRMRTLRPEALLATEPGDHRLEARRHRQFESARATTSAGTEWFSPISALLEHISELAALDPPPLLTELRNSPDVRRLEPEPWPVLRRLRERVGLSQAELARRMGRQQYFVSEVERGQRRLDVRELREFAAAIGGDAVAIVAQLDGLNAVMAALDDDEPDA